MTWGHFARVIVYTGVIVTGGHYVRGHSDRGAQCPGAIMSGILKKKYPEGIGDCFGFKFRYFGADTFCAEMNMTKCF